MGKDPIRRLNWTLLTLVQPGLEPVLRMGGRNCGDSPPGYGRGGWRVQPAAKAPDEPVEEWNPLTGEGQDATSWDDRSEANSPCEARSRACGRCCSALGCPLWGMGAHPVGSGSVVGRWRGNLTAGGWEKPAGGESLYRRASLQEG